MNMEKNTIYTIGYSPYTIESFISVLKKYDINAVCDVRSQPYSAYKPEFSQVALKTELRKHGIHYVFLGKELGARRDEHECYVNGKVDYQLVKKTELFQGGIERLKKGMKQYTIVLLCAEKDPMGCHRTILVSRYLFNLGVQSMHIRDDDTVESHSELENRLLQLHKRDHTDLFVQRSELLCEAYRLQAENIAYVNEGE